MSSRTASSAARNGAAARSEFAGVASQNVRQDCVVVRLLAPIREFDHAALRPRRRAGGDKDFHRRLRTNHCADVAPVQNRAAGTRGKRPLRFDQRGPHPRHRGDHRGGLRHLTAAERRFVEVGKPQTPRRRDRRLLVVEVATLGDQRRGGRAIKKPSIQVRKPVMGREPPRDRAFARSGRTVDGDDHPQALPGTVCPRRALKIHARRCRAPASPATDHGRLAIPLRVG